MEPQYGFDFKKIQNDYEKMLSDNNYEYFEYKMTDDNKLIQMCSYDNISKYMKRHMYQATRIINEHYFIENLYDSYKDEFKHMGTVNLVDLLSLRKNESLVYPFDVFYNENDKIYLLECNTIHSSKNNCPNEWAIAIYNNEIQWLFFSENGYYNGIFIKNKYVANKNIV